MTRRAHSLALILLLAVSGRAVAQPQQEPWQMTPEELREDGWEFEEPASSGSVAGGLLALTVGTVVHGIGHLYAGDVRTGRVLLISEAVAVGLLGTGILIDVLSDSEGDLSALYGTFIGVGGSLFVATWLIDVIGAFKGGGSDLPPHMGTLAEIRLKAGFIHLVQTGIDLANVADFRVKADLGAFYLHPRVQVGLDRHFLRLGTALGVRFGLGRRELSYLDLRLDFDEVIFRDDGFAYESLAASLGLSIDLGDAFAHLDGLVYTNRIGYGGQLFRFTFAGGGPLNPDSVLAMLLLESSLSANVAPPLLLELGYLMWPDTLVGNVSTLIGSFFARLTWAFAPSFDSHFDTMFGRGIELYVGTAYHFWPWPSD